jgi:uncharacterized protein (TIGR02246 family)
MDPSDPGGTMAETLEQELEQLERQYWQALKDNDVDAVLALTDEPCLVTGASGVGKIDKQAYAGMMQNATWTIDDFTFRDVEVRTLGDDTAIVAYTVREALHVDGELVSFEAADASTWVRRGDRWVCAMHSESILGDPFGRDRS